MGRNSHLDPEPAAPIELLVVPSGVSERLQAVDVVDREVVWVSGVGGTWGRSTDGGRSFTMGVVAGAESLEFRDVEGLDAQRAWLLASGEGEASRIYFTEDAGATWQLQFQNEVDAAFYDCLAAWDEATAVAFSDSVGSFLLVRTTDGRTWLPVDSASLPAAQAGEGGFAASGDCLIATAPSPETLTNGYLVTGNAERVRVLRTQDAGASWVAVDTPMAGGEGRGLTAIAVDPQRGFAVAVGGTIGAEAPPTVLVSSDSGRSFVAAKVPATNSALYGVALVGHPGSPDATNSDGLDIIAVGPGGIYLSRDRATTWSVLSETEAWSIHLHPDGPGVVVGPAGYIGLLQRSQ